MVKLHAEDVQCAHNFSSTLGAGKLSEASEPSHNSTTSVSYQSQNTEIDRDDVKLYLFQHVQSLAPTLGKSTVRRIREAHALSKCPQCPAKASGHNKSHTTGEKPHLLTTSTSADDQSEQTGVSELRPPLFPPLPQPREQNIELSDSAPDRRVRPLSATLPAVSPPDGSSGLVRARSAGAARHRQGQNTELQQWDVLSSTVTTNWSLIDVNDNTRLLMAAPPAALLEHEHRRRLHQPLVVVTDDPADVDADNAQPVLRLPSVTGVRRQRWRVAPATTPASPAGVSPTPAHPVTSAEPGPVPPGLSPCTTRQAILAAREPRKNDASQPETRQISPCKRETRQIISFSRETRQKSPEPHELLQIPPTNCQQSPTSREIEQISLTPSRTGPHTPVPSDSRHETPTTCGTGQGSFPTLQSEQKSSTPPETERKGSTQNGTRQRRLSKQEVEQICITPRETRLRSLTPNGIEQRSPTPRETRLRSITPHETGHRSPTIRETRLRSLTPNGTGLRSPTPRETRLTSNGTGQRSPTPRGTKIKSPVSHKTMQKSIIPCETRKRSPTQRGILQKSPTPHNTRPESPAARRTRQKSFTTLESRQKSPVPRKSGQSSPSPRNSGQRSPIPRVSGQRSPIPHESGQRSPIPRESGQRSLTPRESGQRSPIPRESGQRSPIPRESGQRSPISRESGQRSPIPRESGQRSPIPHESGQRSPTPRESGQKSPTPHELQQKGLTPRGQPPPFPRQYVQLGFLGPDRDIIRKRQEKMRRQQEYLERVAVRNRAAVRHRTRVPFRHCASNTSKSSSVSQTDEAFYAAVDHTVDRGASSAAETLPPGQAMSPEGRRAERGLGDSTGRCVMDQCLRDRTPERQLGVLTGDQEDDGLEPSVLFNESERDPTDECISPCIVKDPQPSLDHRLSGMAVDDEPPRLLKSSSSSESMPHSSEDEAVQAPQSLLPASLASDTARWEPPEAEAGKCLPEETCTAAVDPAMEATAGDCPASPGGEGVTETKDKTDTEDRTDPEVRTDAAATALPPLHSSSSHDIFFDPEEQQAVHVTGAARRPAVGRLCRCTGPPLVNRATQAPQHAQFFHHKNLLVMDVGPPAEAAALDAGGWSHWLGRTLHLGKLSGLFSSQHAGVEAIGKVQKRSSL